MQGKERNSTKIDGAFTDHAWANMKAMLDEEMPVAAPIPTNNTRRNGFLLALFLLIGFGVGVGTMFVYQQQQPIPAPPQQQQKAAELIPLAQVATPEKKPEEASHLVEGPPGAIAAVQAQQLAINSTTKSTYDKKLYTNSSSVLSQTSSTLSSEKQIRKSESVDSPVKEKSSSIQLLEAPKTLNLETKAINKKRIAIDELSLIPARLVTLAVADQDDKLDALAMPKKNRWQLSMYAGMHSLQFRQLTGLSGGIGVSYRLDDRFLLRTGVGYSLFSDFAHKELDDISFFDDTQLLATGEDINLNSYSTVESNKKTAHLPIVRLEYLDLPVTLVFEASQRWRINMGVKASYLLSASDSGKFRDIYDGGGGFNPNEPSNLKHSVDDVLYSSIKKFDFATVLGFGYYPTPRVGLELRYNRGMVDYTKDKVWNLRQINSNQSFEFSLHYNFND